MQRRKGYADPQELNTIQPETIREVQQSLHRADDYLLTLESYEDDFNTHSELGDLPFLINKILRQAHTRLQAYDPSPELDNLFKEYLPIKLRLQRFLQTPADDLPDKPVRPDFSRILAESLLEDLNIDPAMTRDLDLNSYLQQLTSAKGDTPSLHSLCLDCPYKLAMGHPAQLTVTLQPQDLQGFPEKEREGKDKAALWAGIIVQLRSAAFEFTCPQPKAEAPSVAGQPLAFTFEVKALPDAKVGEHILTVLVQSGEDRQLLFLRGFKVILVDKLFKKVPRPLATLVAAGLGFTVGIIMLVLTLMGFLESRAGFTAMAGGILLAAALLGTYFAEYRRSLHHTLQRKTS